jgi:hypothetical protein
MSKERELLIHAVERLKYINYEDDHLTNDLIQTIEELLAQPEPEQEPVVLQYRTKPNWTGNWSKWEDCRKESYEDYIRVPILHDWTYETRELYTAPPKQEPFFQKTYYADNLEGIMEDFYDKLNAYDCIIPLDENGFNVGVFEVTVNWREE